MTDDTNYRQMIERAAQDANDAVDREIARIEKQMAREKKIFIPVIVTLIAAAFGLFWL